MFSPNPEANAPSGREIAIVRHAADGTQEKVRDPVAIEEPMELRVEGRSVAVVMRTPGHDEELAAGFLLTEGVIRSRADVFEINACPSLADDAGRNVIDVLLAHPDTAQLESLTRHVFSASSCGICGKATIASVHRNFSPIAAETPTISPEVLRRLPPRLLDEQTTFRATGGLHAAALVDQNGAILEVREDVGRHNAVDKVLGRALLDDRLPLSSVMLFVSGRVSFEIVQKALAARIAIVAGVSAPTSLAVEFCRASGQTLVGFVRDERMNVYSGKLAG